VVCWWWRKDGRGEGHGGEEVSGRIGIVVMEPEHVVTVLILGGYKYMKGLP